MQFRDKFIDLSSPKIMGILNVTPDSFSDGGAFNQIEQALVQVERMLNEGACFIDVGGESTRPGAQAVSVQEELDRVVPVIEAIHQRFDTVISVDTSKPIVMTQAVAAGASLINDVRALQEEGALKAAAHADVPVCLMHMQGLPQTMQQAPDYDQLMQDVKKFLQNRLTISVEAGIKRHNIIIDPGFGFGKTLEHNYQLLANLGDLNSLNTPILIGLSRKSMIGDLLGRAVNERLAGSVSAALLAAQKGSQIIRVHDVKETVDAMKILSMMKACEENRNER